jgi:hypothetical protein
LHESADASDRTTRAAIGAPLLSIQHRPETPRTSLGKTGCTFLFFYRFTHAIHRFAVAGKNRCIYVCTHIVHTQVYL